MPPIAWYSIVIKCNCNLLHVYSLNNKVYFYHTTRLIMADEGKQDSIQLYEIIQADGGDPPVYAIPQKIDNTAVSAEKSMNSTNNSIKDHLLVIILMMIITCIIGVAIASLVICVGVTDCSRQNHQQDVQKKTTNSNILTRMQSMTQTMATITGLADTMATIICCSRNHRNHYCYTRYKMS